MSPEQAEGRPVDTRSDLFSLGSVLYAMCTGRSPFHADTIVASLRRVCDDTPRPIRELNPDIPEWLVAIIDRLLDKNPDGRFQTSLEVGDLLSRYLANLQNPTSEPLPDLVRPAKRVSSSHPHRRRWATAIAVLIAVFGAATISEATGVTKLTATIIRIATGEGTLVVEVDDPTVQISLDGEQLSITGAGIQELKLRPGQYKFQASKDGAQVKTELVTVVRGGRQVLRVSREPSSLHSLGETSPSMKLDAGFVSLFDGETLNGWQGDTSAYAVDSGVLIAHRRGNLFTTQEYRNFALRFDFRLGSGANNGVAIRSPLSGDPAYAGLEIQILDDSSYRYRNLPGHHRHGSIWGVVAAKPASLKFPGQWNHQEIRCVGRSVQVTLNGTVILDVDLDTVTQTADGKHHPGLTRESGYIGFMSIDPLVEFRNIRIKEIRGQ